jgi:hypothetical protein
MHGYLAMAYETLEGVLCFVIIFLLFLNKNVLSLNMFFVVIYKVKFYLFSKILFLQILKNNGIGFLSIFCFLMVHFF